MNQEQAIQEIVMSALKKDALATLVSMNLYWQRMYRSNEAIKSVHRNELPYYEGSKDVPILSLGQQNR